LAHRNLAIIATGYADFVKDDVAQTLRSLAAGDEEGALESLVAAWRQTRATEVRDLVVTLSRRLEPLLPSLDGTLDGFQTKWLAVAKRRRAVDLPRLLDSILHTTQRSGVAIVEALARRGEALASWPADPRSSAHIAGHLHARSFGAMSKANQPFWRGLFQLVLDHDDPGAVDAFAKISFVVMFKGWNDVAARIAFFQPATDAVVAEVRRRHPSGAPALPGSLARSVATVARAIAALRPVSPELAGRLAQDAPTKQPTKAAARARPRPVTGTAGVVLASLAAASGAIDNGQHEDALAALLDAWRASRSPRIAALVEAVSARLEAQLPAIDGEKRAEIQSAWLAIAKKKRAADLPRLVEALTRTHGRSTEALLRLRRLEAWPADPRVAAGVAKQLELVPFYASSTKPFWSALIAFVVAQGDPRAADVLEEVAKRFQTILRSTYSDLSAIHTWFGKQLGAAAQALRATYPSGAPVLDLESEASCARMEARLARTADPGAALLAEIAARPEDLSARLVFADYLLERNDPRGELIVLQHAGRDPVRQRALLAKHGRAWLGPLARHVELEDCVFENGFLAATRLHTAAPADLERVVGHSIWATVERLHLGYMGQLPGDLLRHPIMQRVGHLGELEPEPLRELLSWGDVPYVSLHASFGSNADAFARARLPRLRSLELDGDGSNPQSYRWLWKSRLYAQLERVGITDGLRDLGAWLAELRALASGPRALSLGSGSSEPAPGWLELTRNARGKTWSATATISRSLTYAQVNTALATLPQGALTSLRLTGDAPKPSERRRLERECERIALTLTVA